MNLTLATHRRVGRTALDLPVFGLGTAHLGELYKVVDEEVARDTMLAAWNGGVRFFDTAPWYGRGLAEHRCGGFLRTKPRGEFVVTTKVGRTLNRPADPRTFDRAPWRGGLNFEVNFDYSYDGIMRSYEQCLQRLALDTVDALIIHDLDTLVHGEKTEFHLNAFERGGMQALSEIKASGQIKAVGVGINIAESLPQMVNSFDVDFAIVAMPYTLLDQSSLHTGMAACAQRGISVVIGAPFASGILATGSKGTGMYGYAVASPEIQAKVRRLEAVCKSHGVKLTAAALRFPLAHPAVVSIIPGAACASEVTDNLAAFHEKIPAAFWSDLKTLNLIDSDAPVPNGAGTVRR